MFGAKKRKAERRERALSIARDAAQLEVAHKWIRQEKILKAHPQASLVVKVESFLVLARELFRTKYPLLLSDEELFITSVMLGVLRAHTHEPAEVHEAWSWLLAKQMELAEENSARSLK